ncbi:hypothetical protein Ancab_009550 [Ancistrocladus abbreviatus]
MGVEELVDVHGSRKLIFTYGTLKRGFPNHPLMQELMGSGDAEYLGCYRTLDRYPLVCGPFRVPFLLNFPGSGKRVWGELYAVSNRGLVRMDELEGTRQGHYERLPIQVEEGEEDQAAHPAIDAEKTKAKEQKKKKAEAEAYFGHRSYAEEMWRKNGKRGCESYTDEEAKGYVRRKDRPDNLTFLDLIRVFISNSNSNSNSNSDIDSPPPPS